MPKIQVRRGTQAEFEDVIFDNGEPYYITDTKSFGIGDGVTVTEWGQGTFDGQWISIDEAIATGDSSKTTDYTYEVGALPVGNYKYEVLFTGAVTTGTTSGNQTRINLKSSIIQSIVCVCNAQTRTNSSVTAYGACIIPVGADHEITVAGWANNTGAYSLWARGYRRIGTNG